MKTADQIAVGAFVGTGIITGALYSRLPARIPTHFNIHGVANGWMDRAIGAWLLPVVALGVWLLLRFGGRLLPGAWQGRLATSPTALVGALVVALLSALQCVVLYAAMVKPPSVALEFGLVLSVFWTVLGLIAPRIRRNPWLGVRTTWTLSSDENWARTHRMAGYTWVLSGALALIAVILGYASVAPVLIGSSAIVPAVYSFFLARQLPPTH